MSRRVELVTRSAQILLIFATLCCATKAAEKPNVLFIFADDQAFDTIHALGQTEIETPNLDRLVRQGTTFTHTYNQGGWHGAVCVASRTMLLTGRFLWNAKNEEPRLKTDYVAKNQLWPQLLASAGYETYFSGKWHVKADAKQVFKIVRHVRPGMPPDSEQGYDRPHKDQPDPWKPWRKKFGGYWKGGKHWSEVLGDDAVDYLATAGNSDNPFFMYLAFNAPHDPRQSPQEYVDKYPLDKITLPEPFYPEYPYEIGSNRVRDEKLAPFPRTKYAIKVNRQEYYAIITHMDAQIGRILDALERSGKAKNTYIFFTADHGLACGHHALLGKQNMFDHSVRTPFVAVGPDIPQNKTINSRIYLQDVMPTTLELAGVEKPDHVQFKSLLPLFNGKQKDQYDATYGAYVDTQRMITQGKYKLIRYPKIDQTLLFDLEADPWETNNLAEQPEYAERVSQLKTKLRLLQKQMNDPLPAALSANKSEKTDSGKPNIVIILADDMGYGDVRANNKKSNIPTPHLDRLAAAGMTFTDAHSPSSVCTPTRYGLLTGRYCWRTRLKQGVLGGYSPPLIDADRTTIAGLLQANGYHTAAIGKWHLGMNMSRHNGKTPAKDRWDGDGNVDFKEPIQDSPTTRGFDYFFGVSGSLDMAPYVWIENDRFVSLPTKSYPGSRFPKFIRQGPQSEDFKFDEGLDKLAEKATDYIADRARKGQPFFLYLPLTGPHKPVVPSSRFVGGTDLGPYGDFVANVDATVGQILKSIDDAGARDNTLVIYTSDNGSYMFRTDDPQVEDHVDDPTKQSYRSDRHTANGPLRGTKADIWEAGHRAPFFVRWPGKVTEGSECAETICLTDLFATTAELVGADLTKNEAEDSFSILPLLIGQNRTTARAPVIHHSAGGMFAIRAGKWKLIAGDGSGGRQRPKGKPFARPYQLFDLSTDLAEKHNVIEEHPQVAERLESELERIRTAGRSRE